MLRTCRVQTLPYGLQGGAPGTPFRALLESNGGQQELPAKMFIDFPVKAQDRLLHVQPGAGGYGNPCQRDPHRVLEDVRDEKMSVAYAEKTYGVVIDPHTLEIDQQRTALLRKTGVKS